MNLTDVENGKPLAFNWNNVVAIGHEKFDGEIRTAVYVGDDGHFLVAEPFDEVAAELRRATGEPIHVDARAPREERLFAEDTRHYADPARRQPPVV